MNSTLRVAFRSPRVVPRRFPCRVGNHDIDIAIAGRDRGAVGGHRMWLLGDDRHVCGRHVPEPGAESQDLSAMRSGPR